MYVRRSTAGDLRSRRPLTFSVQTIMIKVIASTLALGLAALAPLAFSQDKPTPAQGKPVATEKPAEATADDAILGQQAPSYPLNTCVVSGEEIPAGEAVDFVHEGRMVRTCCKRCVEPAKKDFAATVAKIDAAVIAAQTPLYTLTTCPVSGEELGSMGDPLDVVHGTRLVRLCCKGCKKGLAKNPAEAIKKVNAAMIEAQKKTYPLTTCVASGEDLVEGEVVDHLYGTTLVRLCCKGCLKELRKQPEALVAKVTAAAAKRAGK